MEVNLLIVGILICAVIAWIIYSQTGYWCKECQQCKPETAFSHSELNKTRIHRKCRTCTKKYRNKYDSNQYEQIVNEHESNPHEQNKKSRRFNRNNKKNFNSVLDSFISALRNDLYPPKEIEGIFGVKMGKGPQIKVGNPFGTDSTMPLGNVTYNAWITIVKNNQFNRGEILKALRKGNLSKWYERKIRNNGRPLSYYSKALIDGNWFRKIQWD
eukprot:392803_1